MDECSPITSFYALEVLLKDSSGDVEIVMSFAAHKYFKDMLFDRTDKLPTFNGVNIIVDDKVDWIVIRPIRISVDTQTKKNSITELEKLVKDVRIKTCNCVGDWTGHNCEWHTAKLKLETYVGERPDIIQELIDVVREAHEHRLHPDCLTSYGPLDKAVAKVLERK